MITVMSVGKGSTARFLSGEYRTRRPADKLVTIELDFFLGLHLAVRSELKLPSDFSSALG